MKIPADFPERVLSEYGTITVYAGTTDGTEKYDELTVYVVDPTTITGALKPEKVYTLYTADGSSATTVAPETMRAGKYYRNSSGKQYSGKIFFYSDSVLEAFTVTPSDYAVIVGYSAYEFNGQQMYYKTSKGKLYPVYSADVLITRGKTTTNYSKRSSVSVKFKAADGTGKYATVTAYYYY